MSLAFAGTDELAAEILSLISKRYSISFVITQPDRPKGRGLKITQPPVKDVALSLKIPVFQFEKLNEEAKKMLLKFPKTGLLVVCSYGLYIPSWLRNFFTFGAINFHPSILPNYRGAAPIRAALMDGCKTTGVSIIEVGEEMDAGSIYGVVEVEIEDDDDYDSLTKKLITVGEPLLKEVIEKKLSGVAIARPQVGVATYTKKLTSEDMKIDWSTEAKKVHNLIRALSPKPGAKTYFRGKIYKILKTSIAEDICAIDVKPGEIVEIREGRIFVKAGDSCLEILKLNPEGKKIMSSSDFVHGYRPKIGELFG